MNLPTVCRSGYLRALCLFAMLVPPASACIWDRDTLATEQARFPEVIDLISGNFPRHSREFYQWRLQHSQQLIAKNPQHIDGYAAFVVSKHPSRKSMGEELRQEAIRGVLGMMRFADFDNPILQEAKKNQSMT